MESSDYRPRRVRIRDVLRYDALCHVASFVAGVIWAIVAAIWLLDPGTASSGDNPRDAALILVLCGVAWLTLVEGRRRRFDRVLATGRAVEATVELALHSGHWLRVAVSSSGTGPAGERTLTLANTRRTRALSRGDRVRLVTSPDHPRTWVLPDLLFGRLVPSATHDGPRGATGALDLYLESAFRTAPDGRGVFLPWGGTQGGYVLGSDEEVPRLRRGISRFWTTALLGGFLGMAVGMAGVEGGPEGCEELGRILVLSLVGALPGVLLHAVWVRGAVRGLARYQGPPLGPPAHAHVLLRSHRTEWRWAAVACAGLGVLCAGLGFHGVAPPCLASAFTLACFAAAVALYRAVRATA